LIEVTVKDALKIGAVAWKWNNEECEVAFLWE